MNVLSPFIKIYFHIQLLLLVSFLFLRLIQAVFGYFLKNSGNLLFLRMSQLLIALSIIAPLAMHMIPTKQLPQLHLRFATMLNEQNDYGNSNHSKNPAFPNQDSMKSGSFQKNSDFFAWLKDFQITQSEFLVISLSLIILGGIFLFGLRLQRQFNRLQEAISQSICIRIIGRTSVSISDQIQVPFSVWIDKKAHVVIPTHLLPRANELKIAIQHEIQHHRQWDTAWALMIEILVCAFWLNPFIYLWKKDIIELQELSCDEILIGRKRTSPYEYGICLIRVAESAIGTRSMHVGTTCMASTSKNTVDFKSFLKRRIEMFETYRVNNGHKKFERNIGIAFGAGAVLATITFAYASERSLRQNESSEINAGVAVFDPEIQHISERILHASLAKSDAAAGFVLVSDPNTGKLLAAANEIRDKKFNQPRKTWSLAFRMMPASTLKPIIVAAAIEKEVTTIHESHFCEKGSYLFGGRIYHDHEAFDHLNTAQTIAQSSDICSIKIAEKLGPAHLEEALRAFGFGSDGVTLGFPEALAGSFPHASDMPAPQYLQMISVGGAESSVEAKLRMVSTPLEVLYATSAIANGGKLMKPLLASAPDSAATVIRQVLSENASEQTRNALSLAVTEGTGQRAQSELFTTAGKTGTGIFHEVGLKKEKLDENTNFGSFVGFAPLKKPRIAIYAVVFASRDDKVYGGLNAAPLFREVTEEVLQHLKVMPDKK